MTFLDRIKETSTSTGTGTFTLGGAVLGYKVFTNGTYKYCIVNETESEWEVGEGTVTSGVLTRTTIEASSNGGAAVSFSAGTKYVFNTVSAAYVNSLVPYTGATAAVNLGAYGLTSDYLQLSTSPTASGAVGRTLWNDSIGSTETTLKGGSVVLKNGVDLVARVVNKVTPAATLTKATYKAVRVSGAQGQRLAIAYAQANNDNNSADTIGLVCETIAANQEGFIITVGQLTSINTTGSLQGETWADGDVLYLSPTTAGNLTNIKPTGATGHIVVIGYVEYAHAINGSIYVKIMNGWELDELHNVYINAVANNDVLVYESSSTLWKNKSIATILGYTPANDSLVVHLAGAETITGVKTFQNALQTTAGNNLLNTGGGNTVIGYTADPASSGTYKLAVNGATFLNGIVTMYNSAFAFTPVTIKGGSTDGSIYIGGSSMAGNNASRNVIINPINSYSTLTGGWNVILGRCPAQITSGGNNVLIGTGGNGITTGSTNVIIGNSGATLSAAQSGILILNTRGDNSSQGVNYNYPTTNNWAFIGGYSGGNATNEFYFGASPFVNHGYPETTSAITFFAPSGISTDIFGGNFIFAAGRGTGTGTPGKFIVQTSTATTTGTTLQTLSNRLEIDGTGQLKLNGYTSTSVFTGTVAGLLGFDSSGNVITTSASSGGISGSGTAGQVTYWSGTSAVTGSSNLFWDNTNGRLGIGTSSPGYALSVANEISVQSTSFITRLRNTGDFIILTSGTTGNINRYFSLYTDSSTVELRTNADAGDIILSPRNTPKFRVYGPTGNTIIQNGGTFSDGGQRLQVIGSMRVGTTAASAMYWDDTNNRLGIGTSSPATTLQINGIVSMSGIRTTNTASSNMPFGMYNTSNVIIGSYMNFFGNNFSDTNQRGGFEFVFDTSNSGVGGFLLQGYNGSTYTKYLKLFSNGNLMLQNGGTFTDAGYRLDVQGTMRATGQVRLSGLPTSATGLSAGDLWNNSGVINIV